MSNDTIDKCSCNSAFDKVDSYPVDNDNDLVAPIKRKMHAFSRSLSVFPAFLFALDCNMIRTHVSAGSGYKYKDSGYKALIRV